MTRKTTIFIFVLSFFVSIEIRAGYDPTIGRWLSRDPMNNAELRQGTNLYSSVANNPVLRVDPLGLYTEMWYNSRTGQFNAYDHDSGTVLNGTAKSGSNNPADVGNINIGPVPPGYYVVGGPQNHNPDAPGGNQTWYHLYQPNGVDGWTYDPAGEFNRGQFNLHSGRISLGCITFESKVPFGDPDYPRNPDFDALDRLLRNTSLFPVPDGHLYRGTLIVY